jgi:cysteine sulfinate desulfinase/cysteine desulfurase-like protein
VSAFTESVVEEAALAWLGAVRLSLGRGTTEGEVEGAARVLTRAFREVSRRSTC